MVLIITSPFASPAFSGAVIIVDRTDSSVGVGCLVRCATHHRPSYGLYHTWCTFYYSARTSPSRTRIVINSRHYPTAKAITTSLAHVYASVSSLTLPRSIGVVLYVLLFIRSPTTLVLLQVTQWRRWTIHKFCEYECPPFSEMLNNFLRIRNVDVCAHP